MEHKKAIQEAIKIAGSEAALAAALGITQPRVNQYKRLGNIPAARAVQVERATGIKRERLRPDIFKNDY